MSNKKYRVWDKDGNRMYDWEKVKAMFSFDDFEHESLIWMQYTGLKDKNDREIYEGDILTAEYYPFQDDGEYNYHGVVEWIDSEASFYITKRLANNDRRGISDGVSEPIDDIESFEIIGNIYEHEHLPDEETA